MTKTFSRSCVDSMIRAMHLLSFCLKISSRNLIKISWFEIDLFWKCQRFSSDDVDCEHVNFNCNEYFDNLWFDKKIRQYDIWFRCLSSNFVENNLIFDLKIKCFDFDVKSLDDVELYDDIKSLDLLNDLFELHCWNFNVRS